MYYTSKENTQSIMNIHELGAHKIVWLLRYGEQLCKAYGNLQWELKTTKDPKSKMKTH